jgi:hypothetical protein
MLERATKTVHDIIRSVSSALKDSPEAITKAVEAWKMHIYTEDFPIPKWVLNRMDLIKTDPPAFFRSLLTDHTLAHFLNQFKTLTYGKGIKQTLWESLRETVLEHIPAELRDEVSKILDSHLKLVPEVRGSDLKEWTYMGHTMSLREWSKAIGVPERLLKTRIATMERNQAEKALASVKIESLPEAQRQRLAEIRMNKMGALPKEFVEEIRKTQEEFAEFWKENAELEAAHRAKLRKEQPFHEGFDEELSKVFGLTTQKFKQPGRRKGNQVYVDMIDGKARRFYFDKPPGLTQPVKLKAKKEWRGIHGLLGGPKDVRKVPLSPDKMKWMRENYGKPWKKVYLDEIMSGFEESIEPEVESIGSRSKGLVKVDESLTKD